MKDKKRLLWRMIVLIIMGMINTILVTLMGCYFMLNASWIVGLIFVASVFAMCLNIYNIKKCYEEMPNSDDLGEEIQERMSELRNKIRRVR